MLGLVRAVVVNHDVGVVVRTVGRLDRVGDGDGAFQRAVDDALAVNGIEQRLAHAYIAEELLAAVSHDAGVEMVPGVRRHQDDVVVRQRLGVFGQCGGDVVDIVDLARLQRIQARVVVGYEVEDDLVQVRVLRAAPVVGVALDAYVLTCLPFDEHKRARAERAAVIGVIGYNVLAFQHVFRQDGFEQAVVDGRRPVPDHDRGVLVLHAAVADGQVGVAVVNL